MSLAIKYENPEDAMMRLRNTVVMYKDQPVYITNIVRGETKDDILRVLFKELPTGTAGNPKRIIDPEEAAKDSQRKYISSKHFDIAPFRLGYVNRQEGSGAFYCTRLPNRIQKQGLCGENFRAFDNLKAQIPFAAFLSCKETPAMIANQYPSFDRAVTLLSKCQSVAFHRDFALMKDSVIPELIFLYHKGEKVGAYMNGAAMLGKKFTCLKESLQEMKVAVGAR